MSVSQKRQEQSSPLRDAVAACSAGLIGVFIFSALMNVLLLTGPFYMLQIYDRVLTSQSLPTLAALSILVVGLLAIFGLFDLMRSRLMARIGKLLDQTVAPETFAGAVEGTASGSEAVRDLRIVRQFIAGPAAAGLFDIPWMPLYVAVIFCCTPFLGGCQWSAPSC